MMSWCIYGQVYAANSGQAFSWGIQQRYPLHMTNLSASWPGLVIWRQAVQRMSMAIQMFLGLWTLTYDFHHALRTSSSGRAIADSKPEGIHSTPWEEKCKVIYQTYHTYSSSHHKHINQFITLSALHIDKLYLSGKYFELNKENSVYMKRRLKYHVCDLSVFPGRV